MSRRVVAMVRAMATVQTPEAIRVVSGSSYHVAVRLDTWSRELGLAAPAGRYVADALRDGHVYKALERYRDGQLVLVDVWRDDNATTSGPLARPPARAQGAQRQRRGR